MNQKSSRELTELLNSLVNEELSDEQTERLEQILRGSPEAQDRLLTFGQLQIDLTVELGADRAAKSFCDRQARFASIAAPILMAEDDHEATCVVTPRSFNSLGFGAVVFALCAVVAIGGFLWFNGLSPDVPGDSESVIAETTLRTPSVTSIQLCSSSAEVDLEKIGRVTIHQPADFRLLGPMRARLNRGQIQVNITEESGRGFVVETPDGEVTDLGTQFGLDVREGERTSLVVLDGRVDLRVANADNRIRLERLAKGDGVLFKRGSPIGRIMSVISDDKGLFRPASMAANIRPHAVIVDVADDLSSTDTKRYYDIVSEGMREDALAYVDRLEHEWNGLDENGMPSYLIGADYVKTFNDDKHRRGHNITVVLARPARLFVFLDERIAPPHWLTDDFHDTGDRLGMDTGARFSLEEKKSRDIRVQRGAGPGVSIDDTFSIWELVVEEPGPVVLGANGFPKQPQHPYWSSMYGIAAVELDNDESGVPIESQ